MGRVAIGAMLFNGMLRLSDCTADKGTITWAVNRRVAENSILSY